MEIAHHLKMEELLIRSLLSSDDVDNKSDDQGVYNMKGVTQLVLLFGSTTGESNKLKTRGTRVTILRVPLQ